LLSKAIAREHYLNNSMTLAASTTRQASWMPAVRPPLLALGEPTHGEDVLLELRSHLFRQLVEEYPRRYRRPLA